MTWGVFLLIVVPPLVGTFFWGVAVGQRKILDEWLRSETARSVRLEEMNESRRDDRL